MTNPPVGGGFAGVAGGAVDGSKEGGPSGIGNQAKLQEIVLQMRVKFKPRRAFSLAVRNVAEVDFSYAFAQNPAFYAASPKNCRKLLSSDALFVTDRWLLCSNNGIMVA
jgi:hypothetical protein